MKKLAPYTKNKVAILTLMLLAIPAINAQESSAKEIEILRKKGESLAGFCANCHGQNGQSVSPNTPHLAGQNEKYLLSQMQKFADGTRQNIFMEGLIKAMTPKEREITSKYFSMQTPARNISNKDEEIKRGKTYYGQICFRCHGANGHGDEENARIAGQQTSYVIEVLKRYKNGSSKMFDPLMSEATRQMTENQIKDVAEYISTMP